MQYVALRRSFMRGLILLTASFAVTPSAAGLQAREDRAAPWIVIFHGPLLNERVVIADWHDNHRLLLFRSPLPATSNPRLLAPSLEVALFWGPEWEDYPRTPDALARLRPEQANQRGRFVPAQGEAPALLVLGDVSVLMEPALAMLDRHGVPTRLPE